MRIIHAFTITLLFVGIFLATYSQQDAYSSSYEMTMELQESIDSTERPSESCFCVAFRMDDFTDNRLEKIKIQLLETFDEKNTPLTVGIVGDRFGDNVEFVKYVIEKIEDDNFELEIGNHGWKHENFSSLQVLEQSSSLKKTNDKLEEILGIRPNVFITPYNTFNSDTLEALRQNEMSYFSAYIKNNSKTQYLLSDSDLYHFPAGAKTGLRDRESGLFSGLSHENTLKFVLRSVNNYGFAVVMMHPYEFSLIQNGTYANEINWKQIKELELLLDDIENYGLRLVPISKINEKLDLHEPIIPQVSREIFQKWSHESLPDSVFIDTIHYMRNEMVIITPQVSIAKVGNEQHVPSWFKNTVTWWLDEKISNKDLINGIEYLLKKEIMTI